MNEFGLQRGVTKGGGAREEGEGDQLNLLQPPLDTLLDFRIFSSFCINAFFCVFALEVAILQFFKSIRFIYSRMTKKNLVLVL